MMKKGTVTLIIIVAAILIMIATVPAAAERKAPTPPWIEYTQVDVPGVQPAACAGQPGCTTICFYINEDDNAQEPNPEYLWALSCVPMVVEE